MEQKQAGHDSGHVKLLQGGDSDCIVSPATLSPKRAGGIVPRRRFQRGSPTGNGATQPDYLPARTSQRGHRKNLPGIVLPEIGRPFHAGSAVLAQLGFVLAYL